MAIIQCVTIAEPREREVRERRRRLADRKTGMGSPLQKHDVIADDPEHARQQGSGKAATDDSDLARFHYVAPHALQSMRGSVRPLRLRRPRRATRAARQRSQVASWSTSHRSAVTTVLPCPMDASRASSSWASVGGVKLPNASRRSISPFWPRTGMIDTTAAPRSTAYSTLRTVHATDSSAGT